MVGFPLLRDRIQAKTARVVVIGLGYVGLPVAARFAQAGFQVTGLDVDEAKVATIDAGGCPIEGEEPGLAELVARSLRLDACTPRLIMRCVARRMSS